MSKTAKVIHIVLCILCLILLAVRLFNPDAQLSWITSTLVVVIWFYPRVYNAIHKRKRK